MTERKNITAKQVLSLVEQQEYNCAISGRELTPETASLDHIVPLAQGGKHSLENVWVVDHQINIAKGTMTVEEFLSMCREVVEYQHRKSQHPVTRKANNRAKSSTGPTTGTLF